MTRLIQCLLRLPRLGRLAKGCSDWVDLQYSHVVGTLSKLAPLARGRLLDVGCGDKPYEYLFRPYVLEYIGVEREITFTATSASVRSEGVIRYEGDRLPFDDASFDTVLCVQVLEHTPDPQALMMELARVLHPEGILILSAPFSFRLHEEPYDFFRYSPHGLGVLCAKAGLLVEGLHPQGSLWSLLGHKLNSYLGLRVARIASVAQAMGKLGQEAPSPGGTRWWTLPLVAPVMIAIAASARAFDHWLPDSTETLGYTITARRKPETALIPQVPS